MRKYLKKAVRKIVVVVLLLMLQNSFAIAQVSYNLNQTNSELKITGTSTIHDWHMIANDYECKVDAIYTDNGDVNIQQINFKCIASSIKSDNSLMNEKTHDALKTEKYNYIKFTSKEHTNIIVNGGSLRATVGGEIEISGSKRVEMLPFEGEIDSNGNISFMGEVKVKMSDFGIKPPTALMGTIKTGDEISIQYQFFFEVEK